MTLSRTLSPLIHHTRPPLALPSSSSAKRMSHSFQAVFARGGTSNGLIIPATHLPPPSLWHTVLPSAMGSPDPYARQLNGLGSGISSTSKVCVVAPSFNPKRADIDFTFVQVGVKDGKLDMGGNCGNMLSAVGPVCWDWGMVKGQGKHGETGKRVLRVWNTNTEKVIEVEFTINEDGKYEPRGNYGMDGVPGTGSRVTLSFLDPAGAKTGKALPTGRGTDRLVLRDGREVEASLVDVGGAGVFVRAKDVGELAEVGGEGLDQGRVEGNKVLKGRLEEIRRAGAEMMGLDPDVESTPKVVMVFGDAGRDVNVRCLALSMGQAHKAVPLTLALCLGAAVRLPGTLPNQLAQGDLGGESVKIGHPSGRLDVGVTMKGGKIVSAELHRTARVLMEGKVFYEPGPP